MGQRPATQQDAPGAGGPATQAPFRLGRTHRTAWLAAAAISLWLRSGFAVHAIGNAGLDDALFVRLARSLGAGQWLGAFDNTTLVKGVAYPLFILLSFLAGIPLKLAEHGVYLAAGAYVALLVARSERRCWAGTALFVALAFNPVFWNTDLSRVIREGLYVGLSLAVVGLVAGVADQRVRRGASALARAGIRGLLLGLVAGGFWLTREEGVWLLPAMATVLLCMASGAAMQARRKPSRPPAPASWWLANSLPFAAAAVGVGIVVGGTLAMNRWHYGRAETVEVKSAPFEHAYGALSRIAHRTWRRYVVFPKDARELAYRVSPAARELRPALDGEIGKTWRGRGCAESPGQDCSEILAGWFQWALRDAVASAGHYTSLPDAARYYDRLAHEIDEACDRNAIPCLPPRASLAPPFRWHFVGDAMAPARSLLSLLLRLGDVAAVRPSIGPFSQVDVFEDTVGLVARGTTVITVLNGWIDTAGGAPQIALRPGRGVKTRTDLSLARPQDSAPNPAGAMRYAFHLSTDCPVERCDVVLSADGLAPAAFGLQGMMEQGRLERPGYTMTMTFVGQHQANRGRDRRGALIVQLAHPIARVYAVLAPIMAVTGLAGLLVTLVVRRWDALRSAAFAVAAASVVAIASRVLLLAYLDVTAIASVNWLYASPAAPFVVMLGATGTVLLATSIGARARRQAGSAT